MKLSTIDVFTGLGPITATVEHDGQTGDMSCTRISLDCTVSPLDHVTTSRNGQSKTTNLSITMTGSRERASLSALLRGIANELDKPEAQLGGQHRIGYEQADDGKLSKPVEKGIEGEIALKDWFQKSGVSFLHVNQSMDVFANIFTGAVKRPDFLMLMEGIGLIAVDAKNYSLWNGEYSLPLEKEWKRVLAFERLFRTPVWYAYFSNDERGKNGESVWYWISALKVVEVGEIRTNGKTGEDFFAIKLEHFERIQVSADIAKLYTHRLPSMKHQHVLPA